MIRAIHRHGLKSISHSCDRHLFGQVMTPRIGFFYELYHFDHIRSYGVMPFVNGDRYEGEWSHINPNGNGVMHYNNGDTYDGQWKNGKINGFGTYTWKNRGKSYRGEWKEACCNGRGKYTDWKGNVYDGEWRDDQMNGLVKYTSNTKGYTLESVFKHHKRNGMALYKEDGMVKYLWSTDDHLLNDLYVQTDRIDYMNCESNTTQIRKFDDSIYKGELNEEGMPNGKGFCIGEDGTMYNGEWKNGKRHGRGIYIAYKQMLFNGRWEDDEMHKDNGVSGELRDIANGFVKAGKWDKGKLAEGHIYEGCLNDNFKLDGDVTHIDVCGGTKSGRECWVNGTKIRDIQPGPGEGCCCCQ